MNRHLSKIRFFALVLAMVWALLLFPESADACPNCKNSLNANHISFAFGVSILLMVSLPFLILSAWVVAIIRADTATAKCAD